MAAEVGALRVAVGADISGLTEGMARAQAVVSNGVATMSKSAKASARVFEQGRVSAQTLLASIDPLYAAQLRYDKELARAEQLMKSGSLTAAEFAKAQAGLKAQLDSASVGFEGIHKGAGNSRIAMMEMQHVARGSIDQFAAGAPISQIFAQHLGMVAQAGSFAGGSLGKLGTFLGGPWGIALTLATVVLAKLAFGHKDAGNSVEGLVDKMKQQASEAENQKAANDVWAKSIDGVREAQEKLHKELSDSLKTEGLVRQQNLDQANSRIGQQHGFLTTAQNNFANLGGDAKTADLQKSLASTTLTAGASPGAAAAIRQALENELSKLKEAKQQIEAIKVDIATSERTIREAQLAIANNAADANADASKAISDRAEAFKGLLNQSVEAGRVTVDAAAKARTALDQFSEAQQKAATAGADFTKTGAANKIGDLAKQFAQGKLDVNAFTSSVEKSTRALAAAAKAAEDVKKANKTDPVGQFKDRVIGAEGTGPNKSGSPAAGIGQFMPGTWLNYFNKLFPDKADLSEAAKLAFRNVRTVAEAVIDKATDDYKAVLAKAGKQLTAANLYTVHVLGAPDAAKFFAAKPTDSARSALGGNAHADRIVAQNGTIFKGSVAEAQAALAKRIGDSSSAVSSAAVSIENALAKGLEDEAKKRQRFFDDEQQTFAEIIAARKDQGLSADAIASVEHAAVEQSRQKLEGDILAKQAAGDYTKDEAALRISLNNELAKLRDQAVERRLAQAQYAENERQIENASRVVSGMQAAQSELLKAREGLVTTAKGRRAIEERLLDMQYDEEKRQLEAKIQEAARLRALADRTKATQDIAAAERAEADAKVAQAQLSTLPERRDIAQQQNAQSNGGPLDQWARSVPHTADQINEALQSIEVKGIDGLTDAITGVITGTESLKSAFHNLAASILADLIQMTIKMLIFKALSAAFGIGGGGGASAGGGDFMGSFASSTLPTFATGGSFNVLGRKGIDRNVLSLNGLPIARVNHGEKINIGNDNDTPMMSPTMVHQNFDLRGAVMTEDLMRQMDQKSQRAAQQGAQMGVERMIDMNRRTFGKVLK